VNLHAASLLGTYASEDEALAAVARSVRHNGGNIQSAKHIALQVHVPGQPDHPLESGEDLARAAVERFPKPQQCSA